MKVDMEPILRLRTLMHAKSRSIAVTKFDMQMVRIELREGRDIQLPDLTSSAGEGLSLGGIPIVIYIRDTGLDRNTVQYDPINSRRFHFSECRTIAHQRSVNRFERYVATTRSDGKFLVTATDVSRWGSVKLEARLYPCKNCLSTLNYKNYINSNNRLRKEVFEKFNLKDFFRGRAPRFASTPKEAT